jgi:hypothetical protein
MRLDLGHEKRNAVKRTMKRKRRLLKTLAVVGLHVMLCAPLPAQMFEEFNESDATLKLGYSLLPKADVTEIGGTFGSTSIFFAGAVPVAGDLAFSSGHSSGYRILINAAGTRAHSNLTAVSGAELFYNLRAGLTGLLVSESRNRYRLTTMVGAFEDNSTLDKLRLRFTMSGVGTYSISQDINFLYGLTVNYLYGEGKVLPVLGLRWRWMEQWTLGVILPIAAGIAYRPDRSLLLRIVVSPAGDRMNFENGDSFPGSSDILAMKMTQGKVHADAKWRISQLFDLNAEMGVLFSRKISILDLKNVLQAGKVDLQGYFSLGFTFHFDDVFVAEDLL